MTTNGWLQIAFFSAWRARCVAKPLGIYLVARVRRVACAGSAPVERVHLPAVRRRSGGGPALDARTPAAMLLFSAVVDAAHVRSCCGCSTCCRSIRSTSPAVPDRQAFETAASFTTNTNWQSYAGESTMSYFSQMTQLAFHNFVSAAVGMAVAVALVRGIARRVGRDGSATSGSTSCAARSTCCCRSRSSLALIMVQQGVIQNFQPYLEVTTLEGAKQTIAMGPVASQEAIKQLGTNGGGFFNANAAHPFENPTPLDQLPGQMLAIFVDPVGAHLHVRPDGEEPARTAGPLWAAMFVLFFAGVDHRLLGRGARQPDPCGARDRRRRVGDAARRQHGGQGGPLRHRQLGALRHHHDRRVVRRGERDARLVHADRRHWCRWSTCSSARWSSAAWAPGSTACW